VAPVRAGTVSVTALGMVAGRRILFLNWRDTRNPEAGGAEEFVDEIASRFAAAGAQVTVFASRFPVAEPLEITRGYVVARDGGRYGVYLAGAAHAAHFARAYDAVVDCQNGIPFFSPLYLPPTTAVVCVIHHVHQRQWSLYFRWPVSAVGRALEKQGMRAVYWHTPFVGVSPSTREEIRRVLHLAGPVHIVPNGVTIQQDAAEPRATRPRVAVVTRLVPHKRLHLLIDAVPELLRRWPDLTVEIAGTGPQLLALRERAVSLGVDGAVRLPGYVDEATKARLLSTAWLTAAPSIAEGWGLTVLEANSLGTPAVAFNVPGLRDSVVDGRTGWLVDDGDLAAGLARALTHLSDASARTEVAASCRAWAATFSWDRSAERLARVLVAEMARCATGRHERRSSVDLSTVVEVENRPGIDQRLAQHLRVTDEWRVGATHWHVLLNGCDEVDAVRALGRAGLVAVRPRLASQQQVLSGLVEAGLDHVGVMR
jgi:glycosyltransferase involved in cell wall biosynthesis